MANDKSVELEAVDESDRALVLDLETLGQDTDGRSMPVR